MAERIQVELVDDIDGSRAQHTVTFALDGVHYEIDLSERHARDLRSVFARYIEYARSAQQAPRTTKQQQREERQARQANRQLTEQIRGAAQRSRERHKQERDEGGPEQTSEGDAGSDLFDETSAPTEPAPSSGGSEARVDDRDDEAPDTCGDEGAEKPRVPAVSLPHFSSAGD